MAINAIAILLDDSSSLHKTHILKHPFCIFFKHTQNTQKSLTMTKNTSPTHTATMTPMNFFKKFKNYDPLEHSLSFLGFSLVAAFFIGCFFYLDFWDVTRRVNYNGIPDKQGLATPLTEVVATTYGGGGMFQQQQCFLDEGGEGCDIFYGKWVWDDSYPLYNSKDCLFIEELFHCLDNGRPDSFFTKWRWQPRDCTLPRFDARDMLEKLRNRRVVFAGDSMGRDQWQSLLCMLSSAITNKSAIYDQDGNPWPLTEQKGYFVMFKDYNCTVEYFKAPFLVVQGSPPKGAPEGVSLTVRVDTMAWTSNQWRDADGHWWNFEKTIRRGGDWKTGGHCQLEKLPDFASTINISEDHFNIVADVLSNRSNEPQVMNLDLLNVTYMTARRKDGHPSLYYRRPKHALDHQDCSHWCLPGVPATWNELLHALFLKRESVRLQNSTEPSQPPL